MKNPKLIKGIYLLERITTDKDDQEPRYYVGLSVDIFDRWKQHCDGNTQYIDIAIQKFGCVNFLFKILEEVDKKKDLKSCEIKWIDFYKEKYGEKLIYNISKTTNINPHTIDTVTKKEIKELFEKEIGRSIYAIAEKYNIKWENVKDIRKPLLKKYGLRYDNKMKNIVDNTGQTPENWNGNKMTKSLSERILSLKNESDEDNDIANECNISAVDLKKFYIEYDTSKDNYNFADEIY